MKISNKNHYYYYYYTLKHCVLENVVVEEGTPPVEVKALRLYIFLLLLLLLLPSMLSVFSLHS